MTRKTSPAYRASKEETIPINKLHPFSNHPFHIRHDLEFSELVDSISESGIITPIIVRPKVGVGYEVISGHRRWEACKELGIESIPARVEYIDDDEATILMVNSNIQREHVLPSEKAFAYKMRMEALKHQGRATLGQVVPKLKYNRSEAVIGEEVGESYKQVQRYQTEEIRVLYVQPGKYPEEIKIPNTLETFQKYVCGSIESVRLDRDAYIICNDEGKLLPLPPNRLYGPTDFFAGPFLICGDGGEDLISLTDSQITKYEKKYHSPLIFLELYPKPITLKCTPELYAKCMGEEHQHDAQENERDER